MTPRDELLLHLWPTSQPPPRGPVVVLSGRYEEQDETPARMEAAYRLGCLPIEVRGANTAEEARRAVSLANGDLTVVTSSYHVPRAFLTFLKALQVAGKDRTLRLWMVGVPSGVDQWRVEEGKITAYQQTGDVATEQEGLAYLDWRDGENGTP